MGQVEVGEEAADDAEFVAGGDEDAGLAGVGFEWLAGCDLSAVFEGAGGGGSGGDDAAAFGEGGVDGGGGGGGEGVVLGVEVDVGEVFGADGLEGAEAYVEGDGLDLDAVGRRSRRISGVKWRPAVGAAAEPGCWE